ncbi:hypothetical protein MIB92_17080 [Aestuariirhabdus sp. Z084]|uniref:hypothetical protein n=1 Tax=Aestuariirhabdus haliotis TaxID=2918751 RepID=UPI00201B380E|nr:hypothetical protein [Aestuariirhabdus haliotis]MCL6417376.1 hypothetical protein [Aestuariirhabdus haliotis]MCL6421327.1 hypothetical protein [Aestuariirhabdus haliotis]
MRLTILRYIGAGLGLLVLWLYLLYLSRIFAHDYAGFLAGYITNSCAFDDAVGRCSKFKWDSDLMIAAYISYALVMTGVIIASMKILNSKASRLIKQAAITAYVLSFPTYTHWGVASICKGFGGCSVAYHIELITPLIMSTNPIPMLISLGIAGGSAWLYSRCFKIGF